MRDFERMDFGINGFAELWLARLHEGQGLASSFRKRVNVSLSLHDGEWDIDIRLPNGEAICVYATPENIEVSS